MTFNDRPSSARAAPSQFVARLGHDDRVTVLLLGDSNRSRFRSIGSLSQIAQPPPRRQLPITDIDWHRVTALATRTTWRAGSPAGGRKMIQLDTIRSCL